MEEESLFRDIHAHLLRQAQREDAVDTEASLAETFGVSRYRVRRVLDKLEQMGVIERAQKRGVTVVPTNPNLFASNVGALLTVSNFDVHELLEARLRLEEDLVGLTIRRLTPILAGQLAEKAEQMVRCSYFHAAVMRFHVELHRLIAEASGNRVLYGMCVGMISLLEDVFDREPDIEHDVVSNLISADHDLVTALRKEDTEAALTALRTVCRLEESFFAAA